MAPPPQRSIIKAPKPTQKTPDDEIPGFSFSLFDTAFAEYLPDSIGAELLLQDRLDLPLGEPVAQAVRISASVIGPFIAINSRIFSSAFGFREDGFQVGSSHDLTLSVEQLVAKFTDCTFSAPPIQFVWRGELEFVDSIRRVRLSVVVPVLLFDSCLH